MLKYDTFYLLYTSWEWQFKFNTAVRGFPQLVALILSLSLWYQKRRRGKIERTEDARSMSNSKMYPCMYSIVYNIESAAAATK